MTTGVFPHAFATSFTAARVSSREARQRGVGLVTRDLAALDAPLQPVATRRDVLPTGVERTGVDVVADRLVPGRRRHLRDPAAHHARSEHADPLHRAHRAHSATLTISLPVFSPENSRRNAAGAFSSPSTMSSA